MEQPGVHVAAVDLDTGTASAVVDSTVDPSSLAAALTFDKYSSHPHAAH